MQQYCSQYGLIPVDLSGCMVGLVDRKGVPIHKPWTLMTTNPYLVDVFRERLCKVGAAVHEHSKCMGEKAAESSN